MAKKGSKSERGKAENRWGEVKSQKLTIEVTPTGKRLFLELVRSLGISVAEFIERVGRGKIKLIMVPDSLAELINNYGLEQLAKDAAIPIEALTEVANGQRLPTPTECVKLCRSLELTPEELEEAINEQQKHQRPQENGCNH